MIRSMTGYGAAEEILNGRNIRVEIKSVNHRYFEFSAKVPRSFGFLEERMKRLLSDNISRGKVDVGVFIQTVDGITEEISINKEVVKSYVEALRSVKDEFDLADDLTLSAVAKFPDAFTVVKAETDEEELWADVKAVAEKAVAAFVAMREAEGEKMKADVLEKAAFIEEKVAFVEKRSPETVKEYRERLYAKMREVLENSQIDDARIVQEAAIYSDKVAVDEETVRLRSHLSQLRKIVDMSEPVGRKLDFLIQEVNRETNTIGSKCSDVEIAQVVVDIKSEIEKIREQIQNIE
ncbi:MAG: YicC/YloC family endoribonuclease [Oscillospiraceae bacterium]